MSRPGPFPGGLGHKSAEIDEGHPGLEGEIIAEPALRESAACPSPQWSVETIAIFQLTRACSLLSGGLITIESGGLAAQSG